MVSRQEVTDVADELHRRGQKPTVRRVIDLLKKGGSPNEVAPLLKEWREQQFTRPVIERPSELDDHLQDFVSKIWVAAKTAARSEGALSIEGAEKLKALTDGQLIALETEIAGKDILIDSLRQELARAHEMLDRERDERQKAHNLLLQEKDRNAELEKRTSKAAGSLPNQVEIAEIWGRIGAAATKIIRDSDVPLSTMEIIVRMPADIKKEYELKLRELNVRSLRKWLDRRVKKNIDIISDKNKNSKKYRYIIKND